MVLCGVVGGKRECPAKHRKMNVLSLLQPTGRDSGCSLLTPFEGGWAATLLLLRVSSHHHGWACVFLSRTAAAQHAQPLLEMGIFPSANTLADLSSFSLLPLWTWLIPKLLALALVQCHAMYNLSARLIPSLKHGPSFTFHTFSLPQLCLCHSVYEFCPSEETLGEWWPSAQALHQLCYHVLPTGVHLIEYKLTAII